jgi:AraC-like DNA-binding protein
VLAELHTGSPRFERVAEQLRMSPRTLRRRLTDQGASFQALVDGLRRERAFTYVGGSSLRAEDLASLLGFSDANAYRRAFKRWNAQGASARQLAK